MLPCKKMMIMMISMMIMIFLMMTTMMMMIVLTKMGMIISIICMRGAFGETVPMLPCNKLKMMMISSQP